MQHEIVYTCGCGHTNIAECRKDPCQTSHEMRGELAALIDQGKGHDEIIQAFVKKYGSEEMLGAPLDRGFSRLAWMFPYVIGATGAVAIGVAARKWTHQPEAEREASAPADAATEERLDDELRNLD
jgi:cytochrome c-type biogenesis protein CcmH/NrfF